MNVADIAQSAHYVVNQHGERVAVQLSLEAWQAVLRLLGQEAASSAEAPLSPAPTPPPRKPPAKPTGPLRFGEVRARFDSEEYAERRD